MTTALESKLATVLADEARQIAKAHDEAAIAPLVSFRTISDLAGLDELGDDWRALFARAGRSHQLFQSFDWNRTWARHYLDDAGEGRAMHLAVVTARREGKLVLVWPLVMRRIAGLKHLMWMGEPASQYGDILVDDMLDARPIVRSSWRFVLETLAPDLVSLRKVRDDAAVTPFLAEIGAHSARKMQAPFLDLATAHSFEAYETRYSGKARKNRRRLLRRLSEQGTVAFVHVGPGPEARRLTSRAIELKRAWLDHKDMLASGLRCPFIGPFFEDFAEHTGADLAYRVSALELDGKPIAAMVAVGHERRLAGHVFAYDIAYEKSGAGVLLLEELIRRCYDEGFATLDLMSPADAYKLEWADASVGTADWAFANTMTGSLYRTLYLELLQEPLKHMAESLPGGIRHRLLTGLNALRTRQNALAHGPLRHQLGKPQST